MKVIVKGVEKVVKVNDRVLLDDGREVTIINEFQKSLIVKDDKGEVAAILPTNIIDIVEKVIEAVGWFTKIWRLFFPKK